MMRVVVDTNILVSFAIRPSHDFERLFDYLAARATTLISDETIAELFMVLNRDAFRSYISRDNVIDYVEWYAGISESVVVPEQVGTISFSPLQSRAKPTASSPATKIYWK